MIAPSSVHVFSVTIPDNGWTDYSEVFDAAPETYLTTVLSVTGVHMHLEAVRVFKDAGGVHQAFDPACSSVVNRIYAAAETSDGPLDTTDIFGREYLLLATPHS